MTNGAHFVNAGSNTKRACLYLRVSTASKIKCDTAFNQNPAVQEQPLRDLIAQRGWQLHGVYSDRASGAKERRTGLDTLMADARRGAFDVVLAQITHRV